MLSDAGYPAIKGLQYQSQTLAHAVIFENQLLADTEPMPTVEGGKNTEKRKDLASRYAELHSHKLQPSQKQRPGNNYNSGMDGQEMNALLLGREKHALCDEHGGTSQPCEARGELIGTQTLYCTQKHI